MPDIFLSHNPQFNPLREVVSLCRLYKSGIEMAAFSDIAIVNDLEQITIHRSAVCGVTGRSVHAPYLELYPGSPDEDIKKATLDCFEDVYRIAVRLSAAHIILELNEESTSFITTTTRRCAASLSGWRIRAHSGGNILRRKRPASKSTLKTSWIEPPHCYPNWCAV